MNKNYKIIAGPCSAESKEQIMNTAKDLKDKGIMFFRAGVWKPRTKPGGFEGIGEPALKWLKDVKKSYNMSCAIEVANASQAKLALDNEIDILWIGARTTTDPFAVQEISDVLSEYDNKENLIVYVKNPVCLDYDLWVGAIERIKNSGVKSVGAIHRGFKTYNTYNKSKFRNDPVWEIPLRLKSEYPDLELLCDPSHITGDRKYINEICNLAINAYGFDGLIIESHCNPDDAWTDAGQQVKSCDILNYLPNKKSIDDSNDIDLTNYRMSIDYIDQQLISLFKQRFDVCKKIGQYKKDNNLQTYQEGRWHKLLNHILDYSHNILNWEAENDYFIKDVWNTIHNHSIEIQNKLQ